MSRAISPSTTSDRPQPVTIAAILTVIVSAGNFIAFLPSLSDDVPTGALIVGAVLGIIGLPAVWGLWRCRRWGMTLAIVVAAVNFLFALPGVIFGPSALVVTASVLAVIISGLIIYLLRKRESRASFG